MARVHHRKARKDYPEAGIVRGDMYYTARIKTGPRSSRVIRQKEQIRPSQLTTSEYLSAVLGLQESFDPATYQDISDAAETLRAIGQEAQERFDAMPENLQESENAQMLQGRAGSCDEIADRLDELASEWEGLEKPKEPDTDDYAPNDIEQFHMDCADYQEELRTFENRTEEIPTEAIEALSEVET